MRENGALSTRPVWPWQAPHGCGVDLSLSSALPPPPQNVCLLNSFAAFASMALFGSTFHMVPCSLPTSASAHWAARPGPTAAFMCTAPGPGPSVPPAPLAVVSPSSITNLPTLAAFSASTMGEGLTHTGIVQHPCSQALTVMQRVSWTHTRVSWKVWRLAQVTGATLATNQHSVSFSSTQTQLVNAAGWSRAVTACSSAGSPSAVHPVYSYLGMTMWGTAHSISWAERETVT